MHILVLNACVYSTEMCNAASASAYENRAHAAYTQARHVPPHSFKCKLINICSAKRKLHAAALVQGKLNLMHARKSRASAGAVTLPLDYSFKDITRRVCVCVFNVVSERLAENAKGLFRSLQVRRQFAMMMR